MGTLLNSLEAHIEWYKKQGYRVVLSKSSGWVEFAKGVFLAFPYHWVITPTKDEITNLISENKMVALKYSTSLVSPSGQISYHVVYDEPSYSLSSLSKKARYDVKKGLNYASFESISLKRLAYEGWQLQYDTLVRQGRQNSETKDCWEKMCLAGEDLPGFESWGAIHNGELVAALLAFTFNDTISILYQQSKTDHMKFCVNNALTYTFTHNALQRIGIRQVFYGLHSLDAPPGVDQYKIRMGYSAKPVRQQVVFNPILQIFVNKQSLRLLQWTKILLSENPVLNKAEGMLRFSLQGKLPMSEQNWPEVLENQKPLLLAKVKNDIEP